MKDSIVILVFVWTLLAACQQSSSNLSQQDQMSQFIDSLMNEMTLDEKIGQLTLFTSGWDVTGPTLQKDYEEYIRNGKCGNLFNAHTVAYNLRLQKIAVEETRLGIPLLFGYDVIHGHRTIFPIPLAEACTWDMEITRKTAELSAREAAASGLNWTFNPMVDISRDPRWGRVAEGTGEDTYLGCQIAKAKVKGIQGQDLSDPYTLAACVKHFAAYGAVQAGRDYSTVDMSEMVFRETYLPPYKAALDAGAATVMTSFNELFGEPISGSIYLMRDILRDEFNFNGVVVTDYTAISEMVDHGFSKDLKQAGEHALKAGVDMDMQGAVYINHLRNLLEENKIEQELIDEAVKRVLELKYRLGLFEDPYRYLSLEREKEVLFSQELMHHSLYSAERSIVLLKNEQVGARSLLPITENVKSIALIGPLADNKLDLLGSWHASGASDKVTTLVEALRDQYPKAKITFAKGCGFDGSDKSLFKEAIKAAKRSELVIMAIGENYQQNGEAASRSEIGLPGVQQNLVDEILKVNRNVITLIMAGRPLAIPEIASEVPCIVNTWHLGTKTSEAVVNVLSGKVNPSGKLVMTVPRNVGQIPIFYSMKNSGRPFDPQEKYTSQYIDVPNTPLWPFGYGLSYTTFDYTDLQLDKSEVAVKDSITVNATITNTGDRAGEEIVQLYVRDLVASVTRPVKELKGFRKVKLEPNESKKVSFHLATKELGFYDRKGNYIVEPGEFKVWVARNAEDSSLEGNFTVQ